MSLKEKPAHATRQARFSLSLRLDGFEFIDVLALGTATLILQMTSTYPRRIGLYLMRVGWSA